MFTHIKQAIIPKHANGLDYPVLALAYFFIVGSIVNSIVEAFV